MYCIRILKPNSKINIFCSNKFKLATLKQKYNINTIMNNSKSGMNFKKGLKTHLDSVAVEPERKMPVIAPSPSAPAPQH